MKQTKLRTPLEVAVKVLLARDGLSLRDLAVKLETTHQYILQRMAKPEPNLETIEVLAGGLRQTPEALQQLMVDEWKKAIAAGRPLACPPRITDPAKAIIDLA